MQGGGRNKLLQVIGSDCCDCGKGYTVQANVIYVKLHTLNMSSFFSFFEQFFYVNYISI